MRDAADDNYIMDMLTLTATSWYEAISSSA